MIELILTAIIIWLIAIAMVVWIILLFFELNRKDTRDYFYDESDLTMSPEQNHIALVYDQQTRLANILQEIDVERNK